MFGAKPAPELQTALDRAAAMLSARHKLEDVGRGMWWVKHPALPNLNALMLPYRASAPHKAIWTLPVDGLEWIFESWLTQPISALQMTDERKAQILAAAGSGQLKKLGNRGWIITDTLRTTLSFSENSVLSFLDAFLAAAERADRACESL